MRGAVQQTQKLGLANDALDELGVLGDARREHLERENVLRTLVLDFVHRAHAALAERALDDVRRADNNRPRGPGRALGGDGRVAHAHGPPSTAAWPRSKGDVTGVW